MAFKCRQWNAESLKGLEEDVPQLQEKIRDLLHEEVGVEMNGYRVWIFSAYTRGESVNNEWYSLLFSKQRKKSQHKP